MKIITLAATRGGVGKSTLSTQLAAWLSTMHKTVLIEADKSSLQSYQWYERYNEQQDKPLLFKSAFTVGAMVEQLQRCATLGVQFMVVDTAPKIDPLNEFIIEQSHYVVVPVVPTEANVNSATSTIAVVKGLGKPYSLQVTRWQRGLLGEDMASIVDDLMANKPFPIHATALGERPSVRTMLEEGRTITSLPNEARAEFTAVLEAIYMEANNA